ncbi:MAG: hypothetical protein ABI534_05195 [Chloroflexota bacterium]
MHVPTATILLIVDHAYRTTVSLLLMALLAPLANFRVLQPLVIPTETAATVANISALLFRPA